MFWSEQSYVEYSTTFWVVRFSTLCRKSAFLCRIKISSLIPLSCLALFEFAAPELETKKWKARCWSRKLLLTRISTDSAASVQTKASAKTSKSTLEALEPLNSEQQSRGRSWGSRTHARRNFTVALERAALLKAKMSYPVLEVLGFTHEQKHHLFCSASSLVLISSGSVQQTSDSRAYSACRIYLIAALVDNNSEEAIERLQLCFDKFFARIPI